MSSSESYSVRWAGRLAVVAAPAEIDLSNAGQLLQQLLAVLARDPAVLIVDLTDTRFCDSAGVNTVLRAHQGASRQGGELRVAAPAGAVRRVFTLTGLDRLIDVYPSLTASLAGRPPGGPAGRQHARAASAAPAAGAAGPAPDAGAGGPLQPPAHAGSPADSEQQ